MAAHSPKVEATAKAAVGSAAYQLVEASQKRCLWSPAAASGGIPLGPHLGHVAHAPIHHCPVPVAVHRHKPGPHGPA
ncbi:hypothetical protein SLA_0834 [Streptomyces laurentii]|uniref:Uncharacterized protein n=1 Tax=Streptomyces laurentii TaxID=39478 RepID=A0A161JGC9_STRLU|nr:hypothetical protein SLA_0834 [Streptomyces laurentii]